MCFLTLILIASAPLIAGQITVDLSGIVNSDLSTYTNGGNYPTPGLITIGGIDFQLTAGPNGHTWVAGGGASVGVPNTYSITGLNLSDVGAMYAIINSGFGTCGTTVGSIAADVFGSGPGTWTFMLVEGANVRDHYNGSWCNTAWSAVATADYPGNVRFDVYRFGLAGLTDNGTIPITGLDFATLGAGSGGEPFLAAVTFETITTPIGAVPEPSTWTLLMLGGICVYRLRRRN